jgi:hypothetical protein
MICVKHQGQKIAHDILLVLLVLMGIIFLREMMCWFFKQNITQSQLAEILAIVTPPKRRR